MRPDDTVDALEELKRWDSLTEAEQEAAIEISPELAAELDRRWAAYLADPDSAISWEELRERLRLRRG